MVVNTCYGFDSFSSSLCFLLCYCIIRLVLQASLKDTATTVAAMKTANKELKKTFKEFDMDELEDLQDDMMDMMEMHDEVQEVMGRSYAVPDELDDEMLEAELDELGDELADETEIPNYLLNAATAKKTAATEKAGVTQQSESAQIEMLKDEFGLPVAKKVTM